MKPNIPWEDFWLSMTHAQAVEPGHVAYVHASGEDSWTPWEAADGTFLMVYCSTRQELINLHNASEGHADSMGAQYLRGWPWRLLLDELPPGASSNRTEFRFPVKRRSDEAA
jgi:hypothetical protein